MILNLFVLAAYYSGKKKFDGTHEGKKDQKNENSTFLILSRIFLELAAHLKKFHGTLVEKHCSNGSK